MNLSNRTSGTRAEMSIGEHLSRYGFWVHLLTQNATGQPFDIIAVRNGRAFAIDAKECKKNKFDIKRLEPNQQYSMRLWNLCGNGTGWFALKLSNGDVYMFSFDYLQTYPKKTINETFIRDNGIPIGEWVTKC